MIYEMRVTLRFIMSTQPFEKIKSTIIEYIEGDNVIEAYLKAGELKHDIAIGIAKHLNNINEVKVYLDAVVAKPDIEGPLPINIAGHYRSPFGGMIPVSRKTLKLCPELFKDKNFFSS